MNLKIILLRRNYQSVHKQMTFKCLFYLPQEDTRISKFPSAVLAATRGSVRINAHGGNGKRGGKEGRRGEPVEDGTTKGMRIIEPPRST